MKRHWPLLLLALWAAACQPARPVAPPALLDETQFPPAAGLAVEPFTRLQTLASFTKNRVQVELRLELDGAGQTLLASTFTPPSDQFHVYSHDLPRTGISGAGRPTLVDFPADTPFSPQGPWQADQPTLEDQVEGYPAPFLIYPNGPVTLRLAVALPLDRPLPTTVYVTYMACSTDNQCLPPVEGEPVPITIR